MDPHKPQREQLANYVNNLLYSYPAAQQSLPVTESTLVEALHDGVILSYIVNCLSKTGPLINESQLKKSKATVFHKLDQVNKALDVTKKVGLNLVNVRAEFIVQKKEATILGLFSQIRNQKPAPPRPEKKKQPEPEKKKQPEHKPINQLPKYEQTKHTPPIEQKQQKPKIPEKPQDNGRQKILNIKINNNQSVANQAQKGYEFKNFVGPQIVVLVGSLRKGSVNGGIVSCLQQIKQRKFFENIFFHRPDLNNLPLLNYDLVSEGKIPKTVLDLNQIVKRSLGVLIVTPQYNGSMSGIIKNALDWLSLNLGGSPSSLTNKKVGVISASYLTQNQIQDTIDVCKNINANCFSHTFYISLKSGAFNMQSGTLQNNQEIDKLSIWYQDFSYFVLSGQPHPEPIPRFIF